ncbi:hypothetical protein AB1K84_18595 [Mesobacillus foraminis]
MGYKKPTAWTRGNEGAQSMAKGILKIQSFYPVIVNSFFKKSLQ